MSKCRATISFSKRRLYFPDAPKPVPLVCAVEGLPVVLPVGTSSTPSYAAVVTGCPPISNTPSTVAPLPPVPSSPVMAPTPFGWLVAVGSDLPPRCESWLPVQLETNSISNPSLSSRSAVLAVSCRDDRFPRLDAHPASTVYNTVQLSSAPLGIRVVNPTNVVIHVETGRRVASLDMLAEPHGGECGALDWVGEDSPSFTTSAPPTWSIEAWQRAIDATIGQDHPHATKLRELLEANKDVFAADPKRPGVSSGVAHSIPVLSDQRPIYQRARRAGPVELTAQHQEIEAMLHANVIRPSSSPWSSPVVLVRKPDGSWRFCIDYRRLNDITISDRYPLPRIDDILDRLGGRSIFSTLDMASGYWQVPMDPHDIPKTAFSTPSGHYEFTTMPFGLKNAPATFQRTMDVLLSGLTGQACWVYLDDIIVASRTWESHLNDLAAVFGRIRSAGFHLRLDKCRFARPELKFLGHIISGKGVSVDPAKVSAIVDYPAPIDVASVRRFLGMAGYYRRFVPSFSIVATPLFALTTKDTPFNWSSKCQHAFLELKRHLVEAPVLRYPDFNRPFVLYTDASRSGLGAVLSQADDEGHEHPVAYFSSSLKPNETHYAITELECLAVVKAVSTFRPYLLGRRFTIVTDHAALTWLMKTKELTNDRLTRWALKLQSFDFEVIYRRGDQHVNVDALSRVPAITPVVSSVSTAASMTSPVTATISIPGTPAVVPHASTVPDSPSNVVPTSISAWKEAQAHDPLIYSIFRSLTTSNPVDDPNLRDYTVKDGLVFHRSDQDAPLRLVAPTSLRPEILRSLHDEPTSGHLGVERTLTRITDRFFWPTLHPDVQHYCASCLVCQQRKSPRSSPLGKLQPIVTSEPWELVAMDLWGPTPIPSTRGNRYVFVLSDHFSKWVELHALPDKQATTVARRLLDLVGHFGAPRRLLSDQGKEFTASVVSELCTSLGIHRVTTTAYHPQTDGLVERFNGTMAQILSRTSPPTRLTGMIFCRPWPWPTIAVSIPPPVSPLIACCSDERLLFPSTFHYLHPHSPRSLSQPNWRSWRLRSSRPEKSPVET